MLVKKAIPLMAEEIRQTGQPVLLTEPGLIARYGLVNDWLGGLRQNLMTARQPQALFLLIANDVATSGAVIDGISLPSGAGSKEFIRIPRTWLLQESENTHARPNEQTSALAMTGTQNS
jgi:hypothetical protein